LLRWRAFRKFLSAGVPASLCILVGVEVPAASAKLGASASEQAPAQTPLLSPEPGTPEPTMVDTRGEHACTFGGMYSARDGTKANEHELPRSCPENMAEVQGMYCPEVVHTCIKWVGRNGAMLDRCAEYRARPRCKGTSVSKHFCIDRFEYPNRAGDKPVVAVTFDEAKRACRREGKRLCESQEWTLACEGPERLPYPTGFSRQKETCNLDKPYIQPNEFRFRNVSTRDTEVARLDQSEPAGTRDGCVSSYGVRDMVGNVDEWVVNEYGSETRAPYRSGLKGGYWGQVRNRCRPMTTAHGHGHLGYQVGFRCCADAKAQ
jgi:formylglycine-generating enzyme